MYFVIELQTTNNVPAQMIYVAETKEAAMSKYHTILSAAAISAVEYHSCVVLDKKGQTIAKECYIHSGVA